VDANGSRFHLLLGRPDWAACRVGGRQLAEIWQAGSQLHEDPSGLAYDQDREELTLRKRLVKYIAAPADTRPDLANRRGAARDRYGNWYWIDETGFKIRVRSAGSRAVSDFWSPAIGSCCQKQVRLGDFQPQDAPPAPSMLSLSGLAITENHYLVVGVLEPKGLLIFDLHAGGGPRQLLWPQQVDFSPSDMSARPGGGVWILDSDHRCYWGLDGYFNLIPSGEPNQDLGPEQVDDFQPLLAEEAPALGRRTFPSSISLGPASPLTASKPISIEALPDGTVLILDWDRDKQERFSKIYRYSLGTLLEEFSTEAMLSLIEIEAKAEFRLVGYDIAFVPEHLDSNGRKLRDRLYVAADDGNQTYAFSLCDEKDQPEWQPVDEFFPMRLFGAKGLVAAGTEAYYDFGENWIPLTAQNRPRYVDQATFTTQQFDGVEPDCVWHRLLLDACIPPDTQVEIWSRAANEIIDLELTAWQLEPRLHLRADGSELPFIPRRRTLNHSGRPTVAEGDGTWEFLFQRARGRFLQLQLRLSGNERTTPHLRALRAYFPRFSYVNNYLPAVYREDEQSASFLERFLANLEGTYTSLEDKIAAVQVLFDVRSAPADALAWLSCWFGIAVDPAWDEATQRMLIRHAMEFFQYRGTIHGLKMALHLAFDSCANEKIFALPATPDRDEIRIVEKYLTRRTPGLVFGDTTDSVGPRVVQITPRWEPSQGRVNLNQRYNDFIRSQSANPSPATTYPLVTPQDATAAARWAEFSRTTLGFVPSAGPAVERNLWRNFLGSRYSELDALNAAHQTGYADWADILPPRDWPTHQKTRQDWKKFLSASQSASVNVERVWWQEFLARRYRRIRALNDLYGTSWPAFESVALFDGLPPDGAPLADWYQFESVAMQMRSSAHRFTVLLPVPMSLAFNPDEHQLRLDLARRIIELEKPAHTVFDVRFYWAMFRVGEARLELDTLIDQGSRAPQLLPRMILGQGVVGESYLGAPVPENASDRQILGRNPLAG
jgi:phage tail-like protein